jgi:hypothetical protein
MNFDLRALERTFLKKKIRCPRYYVLYMALLIYKLFSFFWAQMALTALVAISGPKKVTILRPTPYGPRNGCGPPQDHYILRHKNVKA